MKRRTTIAAVAILALTLSACSSGDSSSDGSSSGGGTTTAQAQAQNGKVVLASVAILAKMMALPSLPAAQVAKATSGCTEGSTENGTTTDYVVCGSGGGSCTATIPDDDADNETMATLSCDNYADLETGLTMDGSLTYVIWINPALSNNLSTFAKTTSGDSGSTSDACSGLADESCTPTSMTCTASSSSHWVEIILTVGPDGLNINDPTCGDRNLGADASLSIEICAVMSQNEVTGYYYTQEGGGDFGDEGDGSFQCSF
jgi:hypothetical protein